MCAAKRMNIGGGIHECAQKCESNKSDCIHFMLTKRAPNRAKGRAIEPHSAPPSPLSVAREMSLSHIASKMKATLVALREVDKCGATVFSSLRLFCEFIYLPKE